LVEADTPQNFVKPKRGSGSAAIKSATSKAFISAFEGCASALSKPRATALLFLGKAPNWLQAARKKPYLPFI